MLQFKKNTLLSNYCTLQIGGPADHFIEVTSIAELKEALTFAQTKKRDWLIIGGGSNLLISDQGYDGLIIKNNIQGISIQNNVITAQTGKPLQNLVNFTIEHELDGMSTMTGIPGTIGGAIYGSAGAYGDNIRDFLAEVTYLDTDEIKTLKKTELESGYRDSFFKHHKDLIILSAKFSGFQKGQKEKMQQECDEILKKRTIKYPPSQKCPGSFFKNVLISGLTAEQLRKVPPNKILYGKIPAGYLLEAIGAKGIQKGQIKVAENHGNTFINLGGGTAKDFYDLAHHLYQKVYHKFGIKLEPEVQFINLPPF